MQSQKEKKCRNVYFDISSLREKTKMKENEEKNGKISIYAILKCKRMFMFDANLRINLFAVAYSKENLREFLG